MDKVQINLYGVLVSGLVSMIIGYLYYSDSVSYTHLDVYKRQPQRKSTASKKGIYIYDYNQLQLITAWVKIELMVKLDQTGSTTGLSLPLLGMTFLFFIALIFGFWAFACLLYTSRCV